MSFKQKIRASWIRWVICIVVCSSGMSYGVNRYILVPIQDQLMEWYDINAVEYNLLMTLYSWPNIFFSITCGILIDKFGVRKMLTLSWILNFIGLSIIIYSVVNKDYLILCIARIVVGIGNEGLSLTLKIYVIDFFKSNEYSIVFAIYLAFITIGSMSNTIISFQIYKVFGIEWAMSIPLILAPFVAIPLFIFMIIETSKSSKVDDEGDNEATKLMENNTLNPEKKFKLSDIKHFTIHFWILLAGFVLWCAAAQSSINIGISFTHHMYGISYENATFISTYGSAISVISYLLFGGLTAKYGKKMEMLIFITICSVINNIIGGWINDHIVWAFIAGTFGGPTVATYPVVWAAIPLLVIDKVRGTAFGFATSIRFGTIAICYVIVGILTKEESGNKKYVDVQIFLIGLCIAAFILYSIEMYMDIQYNDSILRKVNIKRKIIATDEDTPTGMISMKKISVGSISDI